MPCTDQIINYCLSGKMLDDHCCCDSRHGKGNSPFEVILDAFSITRKNKLNAFDFASNLYCAIVCISFPLNESPLAEQSLVMHRSNEKSLLWIIITSEAYFSISAWSNRKVKTLTRILINRWFDSTRLIKWLNTQKYYACSA